MTTNQRMRAQVRFLESFCVYGSIRRAAEAAGITRQAFYDWKKNDPEFAAAYEAAEDDAADRLEEEAHRRAHDGVEEPVFYKGSECGAITKYSDALLMFLLKARRPAKFREPKAPAPGQDIAIGADGQPVDREVHVTFEIREDWRNVERKS